MPSQHSLVSRVLRADASRGVRADVGQHDSAGTRRGRRVAVSVACLAAFALSGCNGESGAAATSGGVAPSDASRIASANKSKSSTTSSSISSTSSSSSSSSSSKKQYVVPQAAKAHTHEGAKAFVKFYLEMLRDLERSPQGKVIPQFAASGCKPCEDQEAMVSEFVRTGKRVEAKGYSVRDLEVRPDSTRDSVIVQLWQSDNGATAYRDGKLTETFPPSKYHLELRADWHGEGWKLGDEGAVRD